MFDRINNVDRTEFVFYAFCFHNQYQSVETMEIKEYGQIYVAERKIKKVTEYDAVLHSKSIYNDYKFHFLYKGVHSFSQGY